MQIVPGFKPQPSASNQACVGVSVSAKEEIYFRGDPMGPFGGVWQETGPAPLKVVCKPKIKQLPSIWLSGKFN